MSELVTENEPSVGKFHPNKALINPDAASHHPVQQTTAIADESNNVSRFQMIRVDRDFGRGRWKVNDHEPPENAAIPMVEADSNPLNTGMIADPSGLPGTLLQPNANPGISTFQHRLSLPNAQMILPAGNIPTSANLFHGYPAGALPNLTGSNQSYLIANQPQFSYYPFYPPPFSHYAPQWTPLAAGNPYISAPPIVPLPQSKQTTNATDPLRITETVPDISGDNAVHSSNVFTNSKTDLLSNPSISATPFLYTSHHSPYVPQQCTATTSPYATIPPYHPIASLPTIVPPQFQTTSLKVARKSVDQSQYLQQAPVLVSPRIDLSKDLIQHPEIISTPKTRPAATIHTHINDLISTSPSQMGAQQTPVSLLSPIIEIPGNRNNANTTPLTDVWNYAGTGTPLNLTDTATATAVVAMNLLNHGTSTNSEITDVILKELTTPTKQNHTTDIDNKISAAMDLVKMHLLSAVREEVTDLRKQIRTLQEKLNSIEHENAFLRQHVSGETYAQYTPMTFGQLSSQDPIHLHQIPSSQTSTIVAQQTLPSTTAILP